MQNTNKNNLVDFWAINKIECLNQLKKEDKEILLALINDKDTKIEIEKRKYKRNIFDKNSKHLLDQEDYYFYSYKVIISNQKHTLSIFKINYFDDIDDSDVIIDPKYNIKINNYPKEYYRNFDHLIFNYQDLHHTITIADYNIKDKHYCYVKDATGRVENYCDDLFNYNVIFCLDDEVSLVRSYCADLQYFLKNTNEYKPIDIYLFFSKDLEEFNKTNYDILKLFKCEQLFNWINVYNFFNAYLKGYLSYSSHFSNKPKHDVSLSKVYFETFLSNKLESLIKPNLDVLAKNGFNYKLHIMQINSTSTYFNIWISEIDKADAYKNVIFNKDFKYTFDGVLHDYYNEGDTFKQKIKEWNKSIAELADEINKYLQHNIFVAYFKLKKLLNYTTCNININKIKNSNKVYLSSGLQIEYGYLKTNKNNKLGTINNNEKTFLVWRYNDNTLYFDSFNVYSLCVYLTKHNNNLDEIELKNFIKEPKSFNKLVYKIEPNEISFDVTLSYQKSILKLWQNKQTVNYLADLKDYISYNHLIKNYWVQDNKISVWFVFPISQDLNKQCHSIYDELKDKIILKEEVIKKMQKSM